MCELGVGIEQNLQLAILFRSCFFDQTQSTPEVVYRRVVEVVRTRHLRVRHFHAVDFGID